MTATNDLHRQLLQDTEEKLRQAEEALSRLRSEIEEEQHRIEGLRKLQAALVPFATERRPLDPVAIDDPPQPTDVDDDSKPVRHADVAELVLKESGKDLHISEIISLILSKGHRLPEDPSQQVSAVYSAMLRRDSVFRRVGGGKWGLVQNIAKDLSTLKMIDLVQIAYDHLKRPSTATEFAETLEKMGYEHKSDKRGTAAAIHKAMQRNPEKFRRVDRNLGTWKPVVAKNP